MAEIATLHVPFASFLDDQGIPFVRARSDRESTIALGHPDFTLLFNGRCLMVEFKDKGGKLSSEQETRIAALQAAGNVVLVLNDLQRAVDVAIAWKDTLGELPPVLVPAKEDLRRFGNAVFRVEGERLVRVRSLAPGDENLPLA